MSLPGSWEFPGGKIETREEPRSALAREIREELALTIDVGPWIGRGESIIGGREIVLDVYYASLVQGEPHPKEHAETRWIDTNEIDGLDWAEADRPRHGDAHNASPPGDGIPLGATPLEGWPAPMSDPVIRLLFSSPARRAGLADRRRAPPRPRSSGASSRRSRRGRGSRRSRTRSTSRRCRRLGPEHRSGQQILDMGTCHVEALSDLEPTDERPLISAGRPCTPRTREI